MAREFVTKGSRFYCISLTPDICKTPLGNSTPPIPYCIKGEFSDATGTSPNIRSNGEPVVISASTVIPGVTGDAPGTANGIKSGTVGKRVQHDAKSKTVRFNGERAIREGDTVWMNDKNTRGKIYERGGTAAKPRLLSQDAPPPEKSFGEKFDDVMFAAADKINAGKAWVGGKVNDLAQTSTGGKAMDGLQRVSEKTELTAVKEWKEGLSGNAMNAAEGIGGRGAGIIGSLTVAALDVIPTSLLDIIPGGGKAGKAASATGKVERATAPAATANAKPVPAGGGKGQDGGKSKGNRSGEKGKCGEWLAKNDLREEGFDEIVEVQNNSGQGMDLIGRNSTTGEVMVWEVKTTEGTKAPSLKGDQRKGGKWFTENRLERAANGEGNYGKVPEAMDNAEKVKDWLDKAKQRNSPVTYEKREVFVDDLDKGCAKHPGRPSKSKPWTAKQ